MARFPIVLSHDLSTCIDEMQKNLKIELARLKSPERIAKIAETKLGLVMPSAKQTIIIP